MDLGRMEPGACGEVDLAVAVFRPGLYALSGLRAAFTLADPSARAALAAVQQGGAGGVGGAGGAGTPARGRAAAAAAAAGAAAAGPTVVGVEPFVLRVEGA